MIQGYIYKITNLKNNKIYVGKTESTIQKRFNRHCNEALKGKGCPLLKNALLKYGFNSFIVEELDTAKTKHELCEKEKYWISQLNSTDRKIGYNLTKGGDGNNTYEFKSELEMEEIKRKIALTKLGGKNPHSTKVKCFNTQTKEEIFFDTQKECQIYFGESSHSFVTRRVTGKIACLYKGIWNISYVGCEYKNLTKYKNIFRSKFAEVFDNNEWVFYSTLSSIETAYNFSKGSLSKIFKQSKKHEIFYHGIRIRLIDKCESTNPDECKGVGQEIGTCPKREAPEMGMI